MQVGIPLLVTSDYHTAPGTQLILIEVNSSVENKYNTETVTQEVREEAGKTTDVGFVLNKKKSFSNIPE